MRKAVIAFGILSIVVLSQFARAQNDTPYVDTVRQQIAESNARAAADVVKQNAINKAKVLQQLQRDSANNFGAGSPTTTLSPTQIPIPASAPYTPPVAPAAPQQNPQPQNQPQPTNIFVSPQQQGPQPPAQSTSSPNIYR